ncbi:glycosyltransferase family protein [Mucilaginibacter arboris]|uniref:Glycosyl transferase family 8 n=1 Tax=Mucilaginibacter arboris TaxID=2682090 RepID=A0A7K1STJ4_9SPHI|nr:hypothetical protein [Mucilaginibacter arboris]MVN20626.1 hypothetical protein [Mucilaginibacter arboris]
MKTVFTADYSVITFATSKVNYVKFALNCARSVLRSNEIKFYIVTDLRFDLPATLKKSVSIIEAKPEHLDQGTGIKLYIDQYLQTKHTLFIDADCLCYSSLQPAFDVFKGKNVSVVGNLVKAADWCGEEQASTIYKTFGITKLARFNGGVYYILKSTRSTKIFETVREIALDYDQLGFQRIHDNWINEEILISIAMALHKQSPVADNSILMTDLYTDQHTSKLNVLTGYREINNPEPGAALHRSWYPKGKLKPLIVHFGSANLYKYPYISQHFLLNLKAKNVHPRIATVLIMLLIHIPYKSKYWIFSKFNR